MNQQGNKEERQTGALSGLRVLDLTHYIAGPYCTKLLTELGAEVIKIERPGVGDRSRSIAGELFLYLNAGKKSISLNLKSKAGKKVFLTLAKETDVIVENFKPTTMPSLGLDYERLQKLNPKLIMTSISNFGQTGPYRDYKATEITLFALSGMLYMTGPYHQPVKYALSQTQYLAGLHAATATLAAFYSQQRMNDTKGEHIDVAIVEAFLSSLMYLGCYYPYFGAIRGRLPKTPSLEDIVIPTRDGYVAPVFYGYLDWGEFCRMLNRPDLDRPEFTSYEGRSLHAAELRELLAQEFAKWGKGELVDLAQQWRLPFGFVQTPQDLVNCPQLEERDFFIELDHPVGGKLVYPGFPFKMKETPMRIKHRAPLLGEHNEEIYCNRLGYDKADLVHAIL